MTKEEQELVSEWNEQVIKQYAHIISPQEGLKVDMAVLCYGFMLGKGLDPISASEMVFVVKLAGLL